MKLPPSSVLAPIALAGLPKVSASAINNAFRGSHRLNAKHGDTLQDGKGSKIDTGILGRVASRKIGSRFRSLQTGNSTSSTEDGGSEYVCGLPDGCAAFCDCYKAYYDGGNPTSLITCMADNCVAKSESVDKCLGNYTQYYCPGNLFPDCILDGGSYKDCTSKEDCQYLLDEITRDPDANTTLPAPQQANVTQGQAYIECCKTKNEANNGWQECFKESQETNETVTTSSVATTASTENVSTTASIDTTAAGDCPSNCFAFCNCKQANSSNGSDPVGLYSCYASACAANKELDDQYKCTSDVSLTLCSGNSFIDCLQGGGTFLECSYQRTCQKAVDNYTYGQGSFYNAAQVECCRKKDDENAGWAECFGIIYGYAAYISTAAAGAYDNLTASIGTTAATEFPKECPDKCASFCDCKEAYYSNPGDPASLHICYANACAADNELSEEEKCGYAKYAQVPCLGSPFVDCLLNGGSNMECGYALLCQNDADYYSQNPGIAIYSEMKSRLECCKRSDGNKEGWSECFDGYAHQHVNSTATASNGTAASVEKNTTSTESTAVFWSTTTAELTKVTPFTSTTMVGTMTTNQPTGALPDETSTESTKTTATEINAETTTESSTIVSDVGESTEGLGTESTSTTVDDSADDAEDSVESTTDGSNDMGEEVIEAIEENEQSPTDSARNVDVLPLFLVVNVVGWLVFYGQKLLFMIFNDSIIGNVMGSLGDCISAIQHSQVYSCEKIMMLKAFIPSWHLSSQKSVANSR